MKYKYITIEREYGSGARKIGEEVAKEAGISCYGTQILQMAAEQMHTTVSRVRSLEEKTVGSLLYTIEMISRVQNGDTASAPDYVCLHAKEQQIIQELAKYGPAVFVGRCAGYALRKSEGVLNVFICGNQKDKRNRIVYDYGIASGNAEQYMKATDKRRANYYFSNTGHQWKDPGQYHMILDSSKLGLDNCVDILTSMLERDSAEK